MTTDEAVAHAISIIEEQRLVAENIIGGKLGHDFVALIDQAKLFLLDVKATSKSVFDAKTKITGIEDDLKTCFHNAQAMDDIRTGRTKPVRDTYARKATTL